MPVLNEEAYLRDAVGQVIAQEYPGELELVIAHGPSTDGTAEIAAELAGADPRVRVIDNPTGTTPRGLNAAIRESRHDIIVRVDGHGILSDGYIRRAVEVLEESGADNVGGVMAAEGRTPFEEAVAAAMTSPFGIGGARFHVGGGEGRTDSVYLGVFRRQILEELGGYDDAFDRAQDWELNYRIRQWGGVVWFSPDLRVTYRPRGSLKALARQFFKTGQWRRVVTRVHPDTASARYLAAPIVTSACALGVLLGLVGLVLWAVGLAPWLLLGLVLPVGYLLGVLAASLIAGRGLSGGAMLRLPVVMATMHLTWGAGFVLSPARLGRLT